MYSQYKVFMSYLLKHELLVCWLRILSWFSLLVFPVETVPGDVYTFTLKNLTKDTNYKLCIKASTVAGSTSSTYSYMTTPKCGERLISFIMEGPHGSVFMYFYTHTYSYNLCTVFCQFSDWRQGLLVFVSYIWHGVKSVWNLVNVNVLNLHTHHCFCMDRDTHVISPT